MEDICVACGINDVSDLGTQVCLQCKQVNESDLKFYIKTSVKIAKQLGYPEYIIARIKNVKNENEIYRILKDARLKDEYTV